MNNQTNYLKMGLEDIVDTTMWPFSKENKGISQAGEYLEERTSDKPQNPSRRDFLKTAGITLGAAALATSIPKPTYAAIQKLSNDHPVENIPQMFGNNPLEKSPRGVQLDIWIKYQSGINTQDRSLINEAKEKLNDFFTMGNPIPKKTFPIYVLSKKFGIEPNISHFKKENPKLFYLVSGYYSFLNGNYKTANEELSNAMFLAIDELREKDLRIGEKASLIESENFLNVRTASQKKARLDELASLIPNEMHVKDIFLPSDDKCNTAYFAYQAAGLLMLSLVSITSNKENNLKTAKAIGKSKLYSKPKYLLQIPAYDLKLDLTS